MKNTLLYSAMLLTFVSTANAAAPLSPSLNLPVNNDVVAIKQPLKFTWTAKNPSSIKQYHLIISKSERFMDYDMSKGKCTNANTCADFLVKSASKTLDANHPFLQQESSFYWQVQAIDKSNNKSPIFVGSKNTTSGSDAVRKRVNISQFSVTQKNVAIDDIKVTPQEAANGSAFNFSATLSDELPENHSVKVDYGKGWQVMQGEGLNYSFNLPSFSAAKSIKDQDISYTIAVFDENDQQQGHLEDSFTILANTAAAPVVVTPTPAPVVTPTPAPTTKPVTVKIPDLLNVNAAPSSVVKGNAITFSAKLSDNLPSGYKVKANYNGDWLDMSGSGTSFSLKITPTDLGSSIFLVGIYDNQNNAVTDPPVKSNFSVTEPAPVVVVAPPVETPKPTTPTSTKGDVETFVSGSKTFSYTKIANDGSELSKDAKLGSNPKDWACTKDNNTGLIWEVKTDDGGLRDSKKTYTWDNAFNVPTDMNKQGLCGAKDWRLPTVQELSGLLVCSDGKYTVYGDSYATKYGENTRGTIDCTNYESVDKPTINKTYFPKIIPENSWLWSSTPHANDSYDAWGVYFGDGYAVNDHKRNNYVVRLVRGGE